MVKLTSQLLDLLAAGGIVDTSQCRACLAAAVKEAKAKEQKTQTINKHTTTTSTNRSTPTTSTLTPHDTLLTLHGSLSTLDTSVEELAHLFSTKFGRSNCERCYGTGHELHREHYGYSEEASGNALENSTTSIKTILSNLTSDWSRIQQTLMLERNLVGILRRKKELERSKKINTMAYVPKSTILIRKTPSESVASMMDLPTEIPDRSKEWLFQQFEELRFTRPSSSSSSRSYDLPKLTSLDSDVCLLTRLHTLHLTGQDLETLENLPPNIKVLQAYGNKLKKICLKKMIHIPEVQKVNTQPATFASPSAIAFKEKYDPTIIPPPTYRSSYPHLLHLGLGFNQLTTLEGLLPLASTLISLDVCWNDLNNLVETCDHLSFFKHLKKLQTCGNPIALKRCYRAGILDVFRKMKTTTGTMVLETLDGCSVTMHLLPASSASTASSTVGFDSPNDDTMTSRSSIGSAQSSSRASIDKDGVSSPGTTVRSLGGGVGGPSASPKTPSSSSTRKKKLTASEIEAAAVVAREEAALEVERQRLEEERRKEASNVEPTLEQLEEETHMIITLNGTVKGLVDPRIQFEKTYLPTPVVEDKKNGRKSKDGLSPRASTSPSGPSASPSAGGKKKVGRSASTRDTNDDSSVPSIDAGWFVAETTTEVSLPSSVLAAAAAAANGVVSGTTPTTSSSSSNASSQQLPCDTIETKTKVRQRTRYYFEIRLIRDDTCKKLQAEDGWHDGLSKEVSSNPTGVMNEGLQRGDVQELLRTIEYDYATLTQPGLIYQPISTHMFGTMASSHPNIGFVGSMKFQTSREWRNLCSQYGLDILFYRKDEFEKDITTTTTTQQLSEGGSDSNMTTPSSTARSSTNTNKPNSPTTTKKKLDNKAKKGKKGIDLAPPLVSVNVVSSRTEHHTLLGYHPMDLTSFLNVHGRKNFTSHTIQHQSCIFHLPPTHDMMIPISPKMVRSEEWNPQTERRLHVEAYGVRKVFTNVLDLVQQQGMELHLPQLLQQPIQPTTTTNVESTPATPATANPKLKRASDKKTSTALIDDSTPPVDLPLTLGCISVYLNSRPSFGPGSLLFKQAPPQPSPEELAGTAAAAAASAASTSNANKRRGKSPAGTPIQKEKKISANTLPQTNETEA